MEPERKFLRLLTLGLLVAVISTGFFVQDAEAKRAGPWTKMGRGFKNIAIAIFDIPATVGRAAHEDNVWYALVLGPIEGMGNAATRAVSGFLEIVSSPFPRYDRPLYDRRLGESPIGPYKK